MRQSNATARRPDHSLLISFYCPLCLTVLRRRLYSMVRTLAHPPIRPADILPPADVVLDGSAPDVFGPSHPLFPLVSAAAQLPDVLTRLIVQYASPLYPRQSHYAGNILLSYSTVIQYTSTTDAPTSSSSSSASSTAASPDSRFSLSSCSWSMSGWMNRTVPNRPQFLLSVNSSDRSSRDNALFYLGYTGCPRSSPVNCFTAGFFANGLVVKPPLVDVAAHHSWEHWCTTLHYPRPADCGPFQPPTTEPGHERFADPSAPNLARRRLYRNGKLVGEDDCQPPNIDHNYTLLLGRYEGTIRSTLHGGLCDVRLYSRALEADEVRALYRGEDEPSSSSEGLEVWYKLDATDFDERVVRDSSGHGRHAAVSGQLLQLSMTGGCNPTLSESER